MKYLYARFNKVFICLSFSFFLFGSCSKTSEQLFSENDYKVHFVYLADDLLQGRKPGTRGGNLAAAYIAKQFKNVGLEPISEEKGYFQYIPMVGFTPDYKSVKCKISDGKKEEMITPFEEIILVSQDTVTHAHTTGELVFVGYGTEAPEYDWDDFKNHDVSGKIVVVLCNDPDYQKTGFGEKGWTFYSRWGYKEDMAVLKEAKGIIYLHETTMADFPFSVVQYSATPEMSYPQEKLNHPLEFYAWMSLPAFERVFAMTDFDFSQLKDKADSKDFEPIPLGIHIDVSFDQSIRVYSSPNVIGVLPGTEVNDECVLYMAHYDHLGIGAAINGDSIYNGAQDNASGTAALISLAEAYGSYPGKRSIVFIATTEEEGGLRGSNYYTRHPIMPLENTVFGLNMDMMSFYGKRSGLLLDPIKFTTAREKLKEIAEEHHMQLLPDIEGSSAFRSDHYSFYSRGIVVPSVYLQGDYLTMEKQEAEKAQQTIGHFYHLPNDEIYPSFRYDGVIQQLEVMYYIGRYYADSNDKPVLLPENPFNAAMRFNEIKKEKGIY